MTDAECIERYLRPHLAAQSIEVLRPDFPRWARQLHARGIHQMPVSLGDPGGDLIDLFVLQASPDRDTNKAALAHSIRDVTGIRPYKG